MTSEAARHARENGKAYSCIYCLRLLPANAFNREHVLSNAFVAFEPSPKLDRCVCRECNQFFGDELEVRFARGAFEGMLRYKNGVRTPSPGVVPLRYVELAVPPGNDWSGVRLRLVHEDAGLKVQIIPQAAFFHSKEERWAHVTVSEIDGGFLSAHPEFKKSRIKIYAESSQDGEAVVSKLYEHGVDFRKDGDLKPPEGLLEAAEMQVEVSFTVNQGIRRCVSKYAFNYLAWVCGPEFVLGRDFDVIRGFIRYGEIPPYPLVATSFKPILHDDLPLKRQTNGHLLTIDWAQSRVELVGQVSLFNYLTYHISLCREFSGLLWRPVRSGLYFDLERKMVKPLVSVSTELIL